VGSNEQWAEARREFLENQRMHGNGYRLGYPLTQSNPTQFIGALPAVIC
jgi:hypothetical protein